MYKALDSRDYIIAQLERKLENNLNFEIENKDDQVNQLLVEVEDAKKEISSLKHTISEQHIIINEYTVDNETLREDKKRLQEQIQCQHGVLEVQKKKLSAAEEKSGDVIRRQKDDTDLQYKLELENQRYEKRERTQTYILINRDAQINHHLLPIQIKRSD